LGEVVQRVAAQQPPRAGQSGVVWEPPISHVRGAERRIALEGPGETSLGVERRRPELQRVELVAVEAQDSPPDEDRPRRIEAHRGGRGEEQREDDRSAQGEQPEVEASLRGSIVRCQPDVDHATVRPFRSAAS
jgi:hypothetical protein